MNAEGGRGAAAKDGIRTGVGSRDGRGGGGRAGGVCVGGGKRSVGQS